MVCLQKGTECPQSRKGCNGCQSGTRVHPAVGLATLPLRETQWWESVLKQMQRGLWANSTSLFPGPLVKGLEDAGGERALG